MKVDELLTKSDLEAFREELLEAITTLLKRDKKQDKEWLRSKEVRKMLNVSYGTLQNLRVKKLLNPTKVEGVYFYRLSEIEVLLNAGNGQ